MSKQTASLIVGLIALFLGQAYVHGAASTGDLGGTAVLLGGGSGRPSPTAAGPFPPRDLGRPPSAADLAKFKMFEPFKSLPNDEAVRQKLKAIRETVVCAINLIRLENPALADCLDAAFDANLICIGLGSSGSAYASINPDGMASWGVEPINIYIAHRFCSKPPNHDIEMLHLIGALRHEGLHALQDFRIPARGPAEPEDTYKARAEVIYQCNEEMASRQDHRFWCAVADAMTSITRQRPPNTGNPLADAIANSIRNDSNLSPADKLREATKIYFFAAGKKEEAEQTAECRKKIKEAYDEFAKSPPSPARKKKLDDLLKKVGWIQDARLRRVMLGANAPPAYNVVYLGGGATLVTNNGVTSLLGNNVFRQTSGERVESFPLTGLHFVSDMLLSDDGRTMLVVGEEIETGDGILLGYKDGDGDGFFEEETRVEAVRTVDLAGGVDLTIDPAAGEIVAFNRLTHDIWALIYVGSPAPEFPNATRYRGSLGFEGDFLQTLLISRDGRRAYGASFEQSRDPVMQAPATEFLVAVADVPGGEFIPAGTYRPFHDLVQLPAFSKALIFGDREVVLRGSVSNRLDVYAIQGNEETLLGSRTTGSNGLAVLSLELPLQTGQQLQIRDPRHQLASVEQSVWPIPVLKLGAPAVLSSGALRVQLLGKPFQHLQVERSADLQNWEPIERISLGGYGDYDILRAWPEPGRNGFYRALEAIEVQGPYYFINTTEFSVNDFHAVFQFTGGSLNDPRMTVGPPDAVITTDGNQVNIVFPVPVPPGGRIGFTVKSTFVPISFNRGWWTLNEEDVGPAVPEE